VTGGWPAPPRLRWGIAGYGDVVCRRALPALAQLGQPVTGIWGRQPGRAAAVAARYRAGRPIADYADLVAQSDAVYIATPVAAHVRLAITALEAGRHVLIEKPLGGGLGYDAGRLLKAAAGPGVAAVAYYRRLAPALLAIRDLLADRRTAGDPGAAGRPGPGDPPAARDFTATNRRYGGGCGPMHAQIAFRGGFNPAPEDPMYWRTISAVSGGGVLADAGSHRLDLLCWLFGPPAGVQAELADRFPGGSERTARLDLRWTDGCTARLTCAWLESGPGRDSFACAGPGVEIALPRLDSGRITGRVDRIPLQRDLPPPSNPLVPVLDDFLYCTRTGAAPACPIADAVLVDRVIRQAQDGRAG
jgi:predicted dehydrogenase